MTHGWTPIKSLSRWMSKAQAKRGASLRTNLVTERRLVEVGINEPKRL